MFYWFADMMIEAALPSNGAPCDIGRAVIADLPSDRTRTEYVETDPRRSGLMKLCPQLGHSLPGGYLAADDGARARASQHVPTAGAPPPWAGIYTIGAPVLSADGRSATVAITWECSGPCGSETVSRYVRTEHGWQRDGKPEILSVS